MKINKLWFKNNFWDYAPPSELLYRYLFFTSLVEIIFVNFAFSQQELDLAIKKQGNKRANSGLDRIDYEIISHFSSLSKHILLNIFNLVLESGAFPSEWRKYRIFFIPKKGEFKFRPISISSCLCKTMERMLSCRINWWLEHHRLMPSFQNGFRKQKSCVDNLTLLYGEILKAFQHNRAIAAVFLDIQSAYDNILSAILLQKLKKIGFPPRTCQFI